MIQSFFFSLFFVLFLFENAGPGHYPVTALSQSAVAGCASGFRSKTRRFPKGDDLGVTGKIPGPGAHDVDRSMRFKAYQGEFKGAHSSFRSESQRGKQMILSRGIPGPGAYHVGMTEEELLQKRRALEKMLDKAPIGGLRVLGKYSEESVHHVMESTVVDISMTPPSFKPVSLSLSRISSILKHPNKSFLTQ